MWSFLLENPVLLVFLAAVILTVFRRVTQNVLQSGKVSARELQESITIVTCVPPRASITPYVDMLTTAKWSTRVTIHLFKALAADEAVPHVDDKRVRLGLRYGTYDAAKERARMLSAPLPSTYVLVLARPVDAMHGWDETLVNMLAQCASRRPVLTTVPPYAHGATRTTTGTFLCVDEGRVRNRFFQTGVSRPQPSLFWSPHMSFCRAEDLVLSARTEASIETLDVTRAMWTSGVDFFAPQVSVFGVLAEGDVGGGREDRLSASMKDAEKGVRTVREWLAFVGRRKGEAWSRRARLGLTPRASHEERYAKYGDQLGMHGL